MRTPASSGGTATKQHKGHAGGRPSYVGYFDASSCFDFFGISSVLHHLEGIAQTATHACDRGDHIAPLLSVPVAIYSTASA